MNLGRRTLLQAAIGTPVAVTALPAAATEDVSSVDATSPRFTIAVLPYTQYLIDEGGSDAEPVRETLRYLGRRRRDLNIVFLAHVGDVTEHGTEKEMRIADQVFSTVDRGLPYSVLAGNHAVRGSTDDQRGDTPYLRTFGPARFARMATYGGSSSDGYNSYHVIPAGGRRWLLLALDWRISDKGAQWAQQVIDRHKDLPVILTTHDLVWADDAGAAHLSDYGQVLWDKLIRRNDQIFLTVNGHYWPTGRTVLTNDHGHPVHMHIANYQDRYYGGAGMVRLYSFDLARNTIDVETLSPWLLAQRSRATLGAETLELTGAADRFNVEIDFRARFAGFAPPVLPAPRPAKAVLIRDTVAYWRFDRAGFPAAEGPVAPGAVARDLSGNGNDLTMQRLHASAQPTVRRRAFAGPRRGAPDLGHGTTQPCQIRVRLHHRDLHQAARAVPG